MSGKTVTLKRKKSGKFLESFWKKNLPDIDVGDKKTANS